MWTTIFPNTAASKSVDVILGNQKQVQTDNQGGVVDPTQ